MEPKRLELHKILCEVLGSNNVYFQPPSSVIMQYPAIVYSRSGIQTQFADNNPYTQSVAYEIVVIDPDPDGEITKKVAMLPQCRYDRPYTADNLNHDVFTLYY